MAMTDKDRRADDGGPSRAILFVGSCATVFLIIAACAIYAVFRFVI